MPKQNYAEINQQKIYNAGINTETRRKEGRYTLPHTGDLHTLPHAGQLRSNASQHRQNSEPSRKICIKLILASSSSIFLTAATRERL